MCTRYSRMRKSQPLVAIQQVQSQSFYYSISSVEAKEAVEAAKFELGQEDRTGGSFADVDEGLADHLAGDSRIVFMPRDPQWPYTYRDVSRARRPPATREGTSVTNL